MNEDIPAVDELAPCRAYMSRSTLVLALHGLAKLRESASRNGPNFLGGEAELNIASAASELLDIYESLR